MIEEFCRNIYNIGLRLNCHLSSANCLCPDKSSYEYLCYQCYLTQKDRSHEEYRIRFNTESGKIMIGHDFKQEKPCGSANWAGYEIVNIVVEDAGDRLKKCMCFLEKEEQSIVELVALALTYAVSFGKREISYISMVDAFKPEQFMDHFWNLSFVVMQRFCDGKDCGKLLDELSRCMDDLRVIYGRREEMGEQFHDYLGIVCRGLEETEHSLAMGESFLWQQYQLIDRKIASKSLGEFIFCGTDTDGKLVGYELHKEIEEEFVGICSVLKNFFVCYQEQKHAIKQDTFDKLIAALNLFASEKVDVNSIRGLEKLDLQSAKAWRANAKLIRQYLWAAKGRNLIRQYELISA